MHHSLLRSLPVLAVLTIGGCYSADGKGRDDAPKPDALSTLERDTGQKWTVRYHRDIHTPAFLQGRTAAMPLTISQAEHAGLAFLERYRGLFQIDSADKQLSSTGVDIDELGR